MKFKKLSVIAVALGTVFLSMAFTSNASAQQSFKIGGKDIVLPPPTSSFVEVGYEHRELMEIMVPVQNRLVAVFLLPDELQRFKDLDPNLILSRYAMIQVPRRGEYLDFRPQDFDELVAEFEKTVDSELESSFSEVEDILNERMASLEMESFELGKPQPLGKLFQKENAYASGMVSSVKQGDLDVKIVMGMLVLRVKERMLFVYLYDDYDEESVNWIGETLEAWADAILAANQ